MKAGLWTQHSTSDGRTFYFNMAHNQSYWELPHELQIGRVGANEDDPPVLTSASPRRLLNEESSTSSSTNARSAALATVGGLEKQRKTVSTFDLLQSRLTEATRQYKHKARAPVSDSGPSDMPRGAPPRTTIDSTSQEYLSTVRGLQQQDKNGEGTDGKWLSR